MEPPSIPQASGTLAPNGNDKLWAIFCHLSSILGFAIILPLVVYLVMRKESAYVSANAREALNFHLSVLIYALVCIPLVFLVIGIVLLFAISIASLVLSIIATVKASEGECYRYPATIRFVT